MSVYWTCCSCCHGYFNSCNYNIFLHCCFKPVYFICQFALYAGHLNGASRRIRQYGTNEVRYIIKRNQYMQCHRIIFIYADINECDEHPCGNNTCNNELGGVTCECNLGYRGAYCEENIDDCLTSICQNNSTCVDGINEYSCICPPNYKGDLCETLFCEHINKHITHVYNL